MTSAKAPLALACLAATVIGPVTWAASDSRAPRTLPSDLPPYSISRPMEPKNVPDFAPVDPASRDSSVPGPEATNQSIRSDAVLRAGAESATLPVQTRLCLVVEYAMD